MLNNSCSSFRRAASGAWLCLGLALFGAAVLYAFFFAARHSANPSPQSVAFGEPARKVRFLSLNLNGKRPTPEAVNEIRRLAPDVVFLQEADGKQLPDMARELGQGAFTSSAYYPAQNLESITLGNAILSRHPLYEGRAIPNHMEGACGVWATTVIDGRKFYVACLRLTDASPTESLNFHNAWHALGDPPLIAGVDGRPERMTMADLSFASDPVVGHSKEWQSSKVETSPAAHCMDAKSH